MLSKRWFIVYRLACVCGPLILFTMLKRDGLQTVVGGTHDGFCYVKQVSHSISRGSYTQSFSLEREGTGASAPVVVR